MGGREGRNLKVGSQLLERSMNVSSSLGNGAAASNGEDKVGSDQLGGSIEGPKGGLGRSGGGLEVKGVEELVFEGGDVGKGGRKLWDGVVGGSRGRSRSRSRRGWRRKGRRNARFPIHTIFFDENVG